MFRVVCGEELVSFGGCLFLFFFGPVACDVIRLCFSFLVMSSF